MRRFLYYGGCAFISVVFVAIAGLRWLIWPHIGYWQESLQLQLSQTLGRPVSIQQLEGDWQGWQPSLRLTGVRLDSANATDPAFYVEHITAQLQWRSLWHKQPLFERLRIQGVELPIDQKGTKQWDIAGWSVSLEDLTVPQANATGAQHEWLVWLLQQSHLSVQDVHVYEVNSDREKLAKQSWDIEAQLSKQGDQHQLQIEVTDTYTDAAALVYAQIQHPTPYSTALQDASAQWYAQIKQPHALLAGLSFPETSFQAEQAQLELWGGYAEHSWEPLALKLTFQKLVWQTNAAFQAASDKLEVNWRTPIHDLQHWFDSQSLQNLGVNDFAFHAQGLKLHPLDELSDPVKLDHVRARGRWAQQQLTVALDRVENNAVQLGAWMRWRPNDNTKDALHAYARIDRFDLTAISEYFPTSVDAEVKDWLQSGLLAGQLKQGALVWQGDPQQFPYQHDPKAGYFYVGGAIEHATVDYAPPEPNYKGWPAVKHASGSLYMERGQLKASFPTAHLAIPQHEAVTVHNLHFSIPDLTQDSTLHLQGDTQGSAQSYTALFRESDLGALLEHSLDDTYAQGSWQVGLQLIVPLAQAENTQVSGRIQLAPTRLRLFTDWPPIEQLTGTLFFDEYGIQAEALQGAWLGRSIHAKGVLSTRVEAPIEPFTIRGTFDASVLKDWGATSQAALFTGHTPFNAVLNLTPAGALSAQVHSSLQGLEVALPEPLRKSASESWPLALHWESDPDRPELERWRIQLNNQWHALLEHDSAQDKASSYFNAVSLALNRTLPPLQVGLQLDLQQEHVNFDAWRSWLMLMDDESDATNWLPALRSARVQSASAQIFDLPLEHFTLRLTQPKAHTWTADVSASELAGRVLWREPTVNQDSEVQAHFQRVRLRSSLMQDDRAQIEETLASELSDNHSLRLPRVGLHIEQLQVDNKQFGEIHLQAIPKQENSVWQLQNLQWQAPGMTAQGQGYWRFAGAQAGLRVEVQAELANVEEFLEFFGAPGLIHQGKGHAQLQLTWSQLPDRIRLNDIDAELQLTLKNGRFSSIQSRSAKLLELLSISSLSRLARLELGVGKAFKEGFPFDQVEGQFALRQSQLYTQNYEVLSPVGRILLNGKVALKEETLDLDVMVFPKLDMSGAAIAAGFVVNPLVGVGAFLTQWVMQRPLAEAMQVHYQVQGHWDDPDIQALPTKKATETNPSPQLKPERFTPHHDAELPLSLPLRVLP